MSDDYEKLRESCCRRIEEFTHRARQLGKELGARFQAEIRGVAPFKVLRTVGVHEEEVAAAAFLAAETHLRSYYSSCNGDLPGLDPRPFGAMLESRSAFMHVATRLADAKAAARMEKIAMKAADRAMDMAFQSVRDGTIDTFAEAPTRLAALSCAFAAADARENLLVAVYEAQFHADCEAADEDELFDEDEPKKETIH